MTPVPQPIRGHLRFQPFAYLHGEAPNDNFRQFRPRPAIGSGVRRAGIASQGHQEHDDPGHRRRAGPQLAGVQDLREKTPECQRGREDRAARLAELDALRGERLLDLSFREHPGEGQPRGLKKRLQPQRIAVGGLLSGVIQRRHKKALLDPEVRIGSARKASCCGQDRVRKALATTAVFRCAPGSLSKPTLGASGRCLRTRQFVPDDMRVPSELSL